MSSEVRWRRLAYVPAALAVARTRRRLGLPRAASCALAVSVPVTVARSLPRGVRRDVAVWIAQMWAYKVCFEVPYDRPEQLRERLRVDEPIRADAVIGRGRPISERLQRRLRRPPEITPLDRAAAVVYAAWEAEPHAALAWVRWRHPERFAAAAARLAVTFDSTLVGYFATPTAPPWWASEQAGRMDGAVHRVTLDALRALRGKPPTERHNKGTNPWASMPSDHFASALTAAIVLSGADRRAGVIGWAYALGLGAVLVYTGEHYVVDLAAGLALAVSVNAIDRAAGEPLGRAASAVLGPAD